MAFCTLVYSPKESSLELTIVGPLGLNGFLHLGLLFPKGEFLRTHRVGPLGLNGFLHLGLLYGIFHPYEPWPLFSGWVGGGGAYFLVKF